MTTMNSEVMNESNEGGLREINSWDELSLSSDILRGIYAHGFEMPSPIQKKAIGPLIEKKDIIAQAQSGTGKTATFTIGALANIDLSSNTTQVLVMSPTKELTIQTGAVFKAISQFMTGLRIQLAYGGSVIEEGSSFSSRNIPHIICGCPGRVYDMMRRDRISSKTIKLIKLTFSNFMKYGEDNVIDFQKMSNIYGICAENDFGKSTIIDIIMFSIFGEATRGSKVDYINYDSKTAQTEIILEQFNKIKDDIDYLTFISENGYEWFKNNGTIDSHVNILKELIKFDILIILKSGSSISTFICLPRLSLTYKLS